MAPSVETFIAVLKRSGLVDGTVLDDSLDSFSHTGEEASPQQFAQYLINKRIVTPWQAEKLLKGKHKGFFLGKYKLLSILGKGGMSSVYLAEHVVMRRRCAIKVLPWKRVDDGSYLERFHREAQAVATLDHPNIVRAYDVDHEKDGNLEINFLVMEYVEGQNLYELVQRQGVLSPVQAAEFIRQGALGLEHAHSVGLIHRDIKPGNFLVDRNHVVKLMDLGLARVAAEDDEFSVTIANNEKVLGTADYLAPEQAVNSHTADHRADIYGLGCTFFYLLVGRPPFAEGTLTERLLAHQTKEPPAIETIRDDIPDDLIAIMKAMMAKDREQRIQTAGEVADLLTEWLEHHGGETWTPPEDRLVRRGNKPPSDISKQAVKSDVIPAQPSLEKQSAAPEPTSIAPENKEPEAPSAEQQTDAGNELSSFLTNLAETEKSSMKLKAISKPAPPQKTLPKPPTTAPEPPASSPRDKKTKTVDPKPLPPSISEIDTSLSGESLSTTAPIVHNIDTLPDVSDAAPVDTVGQKTLPFPTKKPSRQKMISQALAMISIVAIVIVAFLVMRPEQQDVPTTRPVTVDKLPTRPPVTGNSVTVGPQGNFATLREAVDYVINDEAAVPGSPKEILLAAGMTLSEPLIFANSVLDRFPKGVRIKGDPQNPPILKPSGNGPALEIQDIEGLTLEHLIIQCNGRPVAVKLSGYLLRSRFSNVRLLGIEEHGIIARGVSGIGGDRFVLDRCLFECSGSSAVALQFEDSDATATRKVVIENCRFLGPGATGVQVEGDLFDSEIRLNIFHDLQQGITFAPQSSQLTNLEIVNNTFHKAQRGVSFNTSATKIAENIKLLQNLFVNVEAEVWSEESEFPALLQQARFNWSNQTHTGPHQLNVFEKEGRQGSNVEFHSLDPQQATFLKPKTTELRTLVKQPYKNTPYIGALSP